MKKSSRSGHRKAAEGEPQLGIFWFVRGNLLIDSMPLSKSERYHDHQAYPHSHIDIWERWRLGGKVPHESEYEEFPRGRVMYNTKTKTFTLLADRCILRDSGTLSTIMSAMNLPRNTDKGTDAHYRCFHCLHGSEKEE
jgi:hypothetical protein